MSESKHTPGPWTVGDTRLQRVHERLQPMHETAVHCGGSETRGNCLAIVYLGGNGALRSDKESVEANARLISAAPDLLTACEEVLNEMRAYNGESEFDETCPMKPTFDLLKNAIARARGEVEEPEVGNA